MTPTNRLEAIEARLKASVQGDYVFQYGCIEVLGPEDKKGDRTSRSIAIMRNGNEHDKEGELLAHAPADLAWAVARIRELREALEKKDAALLEAKIELDRNWGTFYDGRANGGSGTRRSNAKMAWFTVTGALALRVDAGEMK